MAESTTVQNTRNTLTITLRATMRLEPGSTVTISGLVGSTTSDGAVSLAGADAGLFQGAVQTGAAYLVTLTVADGQVCTSDPGFWVSGVSSLHHGADA